MSFLLSPGTLLHDSHLSPKLSLQTSNQLFNAKKHRFCLNLPKSVSSSVKWGYVGNRQDDVSSLAQHEKVPAVATHSRESQVNMGNCKRMLLQKTGEAEKERERSWFYLDGIQDPKNPDVVCFALILFSTKEKFHFQIMRQKLRFINIQRSSFQYILYLYPLWYNISPNLFSLYSSLCWVLYCGA